MKANRLDKSPIVYYTSGHTHAPWVLFLHAAFVNHHMFDAQFAYFKNSYNLLAVDIIGHGQSIDTHKGDNLDQMSVWIHEILQAEKIVKIHVVGVSLGAVLAQDFANRYPQEVQSLACFGGYDINHFDAAMQKENGSSQMRMMAKAFLSVKWFAKDNKRISAHTRQAQKDFYDMNVQFPKKSFKYLASLQKMINVYPSQQRAYPLLIGCGEYDIKMELNAVHAWKQNEPTCQMVIFEDAGHCVNMDVPQAFHKRMEEFWRCADSGKECAS